MASTIVGDLFESNASIIVHQTNCVTRKPHGISEQIARRWPNANVYAKRQGATPNTAHASEEGIPGMCVMLPTGSSRTTGPWRIAALMGQVCPGDGKSNYWCLRYKKHFADDTAAARLKYFKDALHDLASQLTELKETDGPFKKTIAFPYRVGCGLAGGQWSLYEPLIQAFAKTVAENGWKTYIYKK